MSLSMPEIKLQQDKVNNITLVLNSTFVKEVSSLDDFKFERNGTYKRKRYIDKEGTIHREVAVQRYKLSHLASNKYIAVSATDKGIVQKIEQFTNSCHNSIPETA